MLGFNRNTSARHAKSATNNEWKILVIKNSEKHYFQCILWFQRFQDCIEKGLLLQKILKTKITPADPEHLSWAIKHCQMGLCDFLLVLWCRVTNQNHACINKCARIRPTTQICNRMGAGLLNSAGSGWDGFACQPDSLFMTKQGRKFQSFKKKNSCQVRWYFFGKYYQKERNKDYILIRTSFGSTHLFYWQIQVAVCAGIHQCCVRVQLVKSESESSPLSPSPRVRVITSESE